MALANIKFLGITLLDWFIDISVPSHMICSTSHLSLIQSISNNCQIFTMNGWSLLVVGESTLTLALSFDRSFTLSKVLYVPNLTANFIFIDRLVENNCLALFSKYGCIVLIF